MRKIAVVTVGRSDYGIYLPILTELARYEDVQLGLIVSGAHLSPEFGRTVDSIRDDGFPIAAEVEMLLSSDSPTGISTSMGLGMVGFAHAFASGADLLVVLGDRFEMFAAAAAALPFKIPVAHIHGGELTLGAIDDALRHAISKLSHVHFVSTAEYGRRLVQMGEDSSRVVVSGAPSLDNLETFVPLTTEELRVHHGLCVTDRPLLVTFHAETLDYERVEFHVGELLAALEALALPTIFTMPNEDTGGRVIRARIADYLRRHPDAQSVESLGTRGYFTLMSRAAAMVGNSSSGLIEAPSFALPAVNVGRRQAGRVRGANVIDVDYDRAQIIDAVKAATSGAFRARLTSSVNPYRAAGNASRIIVDTLRTVALGDGLVNKTFRDLPGAEDWPPVSR